MRKAMRGDLVSASRDLGDQTRESLGDEAQDEERGLGAATVEDVQKRVRVGDHAVTDGQAGIERRLLPVFEVDSENVAGHARAIVTPGECRNVVPFGL
jgi:hypothetical protein